ncbi:S8 family serine peptidase [Archangium minus]|uniref:S8 family serine peptidase n=1 Tax=Archangium minus TaxID=83450 RepID=A0ABY9WJW1_9BACT|nr:S8 family serine peptidase [Archangium minus]
MHHPSWKNLLFAVNLSVLSACGGESPTTGAREPALDTASPLASLPAGKLRKSTDAIAGQYIVVLKDGAIGTFTVNEVAQSHARQFGVSFTHTYAYALRGYAVRATEAGARAIAARPEVDYVVEDGKATLDYSTQTNAPSNLDIMDQYGSGTYNYGTTGAGVHAYIIDSGIMTSHPEFGGRASADISFINDGRGAEDCLGHGTHVAGTVGGTTYGVAKNVRLHAVRVGDCAGGLTISGIVAGVDWVTRNHIKPAVANMSLSAGVNDAMDQAVRGSIAAGVVYVAAAGNDNIDACARTPAHIPEALTVGAYEYGTYSRASFSNYGSCLDVFAPGVWIRSATLDGASDFKHGTSMAAPHVTGAVARYLESNPRASPATVHTAIVQNSPPNRVADAGIGSPTRLIASTALGQIGCGYLNFGESLIPGQTLYSCAGNVWLTHQTDGNVVLYDRLGALWHTQTWNNTSSTFVMQMDGHLVLYNGTGGALWGTGTWGNPNAYLVVGNDCNLVLVGNGGTRLWQSNTTCR